MQGCILANETEFHMLSLLTKSRVLCAWCVLQINWMLMLGCVAMVAGFQDTTALGHAYGVAVMSVMFMTTILAAIVMMVCYGINPLLVALFAIFFGKTGWVWLVFCRTLSLSIHKLRVFWRFALQEGMAVCG